MRQITCPLSHCLPSHPLSQVVTEASAQAQDLVRELREGEERLQRSSKSVQSGQGALLWSLIADGVDEAASWFADEENLGALCERALKLRGGLTGGKERLVMREKARIFERLSKAAQEPPRYPADLLALWDEATRLEPLVRLRVSEARWRTDQDAVPFTTTPLSRIAGSGPDPVPPGKKTADPSEIPALIDALLAFLETSSLDPVLTAAHAPQLIGRIHPFADGNGHTGRMLLCDLLSRTDFGAPTLVSYIGVHRRRAEQWAALMDLAGIGQACADELVAFQLDMLKEAQAVAMQRFDG